jgi:hypothetical protein
LDGFGAHFLEKIITGDEIWIYHYEPDCKHWSMEWKHPHSPTKKKFKMHSTPVRLVLTVFWDSQGLLLEHYHERGLTVNSSQYSEMLNDKMKHAV